MIGGIIIFWFVKYEKIVVINLVLYEDFGKYSLIIEFGWNMFCFDFLEYKIYLIGNKSFYFIIRDKVYNLEFLESRGGKRRV